MTESQSKNERERGARGRAHVEVIVIGGSAGSLEALSHVLPALPDAFSIPIVMVLHIPPGGPSQLPQVLAYKCKLPVKEAEDKEPIAPATVYVAPPNYHLLVERNRYFSLSVDESVNFSRPSIDVLFESAAVAYGASLAGVILTGANEDGAAGLAQIKKVQGRTIVQSPDTSAVPTMPEAALKEVCPDLVLPLDEIGRFLASLDPLSPVRRC